MKGMQVVVSGKSSVVLNTLSDPNDAELRDMDDTKAIDVRQ